MIVFLVLLVTEEQRMLSQKAGIAQWLKHRTGDWKVAGSSPRRSGRRIFFSRVNFLCCWLLFRYPFHPRVTAVARKRRVGCWSEGEGVVLWRRSVIAGSNHGNRSRCHCTKRSKVKSMETASPAAASGVVYTTPHAMHRFQAGYLFFFFFFLFMREIDDMPIYS